MRAETMRGIRRWMAPLQMAVAAIALLVLLAGCGIGGSSSPTPVPHKVLMGVMGPGSQTSPTFSVAGTWHINWNFDCSAVRKDAHFHIGIGGTGGGADLPGVTAVGGKASGTYTVPEGGLYHLEITAPRSCGWKATVST